MPRGRASGRGRGRGRGGGRGRSASVSVHSGSDDLESSFDIPYNGGESSTPSSRSSSFTSRGRSGGGGRARGGVARGLGSTSPSSLSATTAAAPEARTTPPPDEAAPPVVVVVPQGRMITRSLLRGTSSLLFLDDSAAAAASETALTHSRRTRASRTPPPPRNDSLTPLLLGNGHSGTPLASAASLPSPSSSTTALTSFPGTPAPATPSPSLPLASLAANGSPASAVAPAPRVVVVGGLLRCVCSAFLVSPSETLLECSRCRNWCHPACVGVDGEEVRRFLRQRDFVCPYCVPPADVGAGVAASGPDLSVVPREAPPAPASSTPPPPSPRHGVTERAAPEPDVPTPGPPQLSNTFGTAPPPGAGDGGRRPLSPSAASSPVMAGVSTASSTSSAFPLASRQPPVPRQPPQKLREVPDARPPAALAATLEGLLQAAEETAEELGYHPLHLPDHTLTDAQVGECLACCADAIREATFSPDYPAYCLKEVQQRRHPYVQGTALQSKQDGAVCAFVLSNGRDFYGNMRSTITQLKSSLHRGCLDPADVTPFMAHCMTIHDVSDFVHITLSATHAAHQRRGLARLLMAMELLKWALRGRTRAFLNMAIEKRLVDGGTRIEFASPAASRHLYASFGFTDVFPRYDAATGKERWTAKEADMGRVMANVGFVESVQSVAASYQARREAARRSSPPPRPTHPHEQRQSRSTSNGRVRGSATEVAVSPAPPRLPLETSPTSDVAAHRSSGQQTGRGGRRSPLGGTPERQAQTATDATRTMRKRHRSGSPTGSPLLNGGRSP